MSENPGDVSSIDEGVIEMCEAGIEDADYTITNVGTGEVIYDSQNR